MNWRYELWVTFCFGLRWRGCACVGVDGCALVLVGGFVAVFLLWGCVLTGLLIWWLFAIWGLVGLGSRVGCLRAG